jgi:hypothetical protein
MNSTGIAKRGSTIRKIGWLTVGSMLAMALLAPAANAVEGKQSGTDIRWDEATQLCTGGPDGDIVAGPGEVAWVFIHTGVDGPGTLSAHFVTAGDVTAPSYVQGNLKYIVWTGPDTLQTFSDNIDGGILTLSHVCAGTTTTTTSTSTSTTSTSTTTTSSTTTSSTTTSTTTVATTPAPSQQVLSETSDPSTTLPPTDTFAGEASAQPSGSAMRLMLIAMAGLLAAVMVLTPAKVGNRR